MEENKPTEKKKPGTKPKYVYLDKFERVLEGLTLTDQKIAEASDKNTAILLKQIDRNRIQIKGLRYMTFGLVAIYLVDILIRVIF